MVYKKYITKDGKRFGPYLYESYRDEKGDVKTRYVSGPEDSQKISARFFVLFGILAVVLIGVFLIFNFSNNSFFTGFSVDGGDSGDGGGSGDGGNGGGNGGGGSSEGGGNNGDNGNHGEGNNGNDGGETTSSESTTTSSEESPIELSPVETTTEQPSETSEDTPVEEPAQEPVGQPEEETPTETPIETPIEEPAEETPTENPTETPVTEENETLETPVEEPVQEPVINETIPETPTETPVQNITTSGGAGETTGEINITENEILNETSLLNSTVSEENSTVVDETINLSTTTITKQYGAILGKPVKWKKNVYIETELNKTVNEKIKIELPSLAGNVSVKKIYAETNIEQEITENAEILNEKILEDKDSVIITGNVIGSESGNGIITRILKFFSGLFNSFFSLTGRVIDTAGENVTVSVQEEMRNEDQIVVEYYTDAPYAEETLMDENNKEVVIVGPDEVHYQEILASSELPSETNNANLIKLYWIVDEIKQTTVFEALDSDENGLFDSIQWIVPHLSNQTYEIEIINITRAEHLDENRNFISDIFDFVKNLDGNWSEQINNNEYVRVTFEKTLDNTRDITVYARDVDNSSSSIEVYAQNSNNLIATIKNISNENLYKTYLTGLVENESYDTFDLKILGSPISFDWIVDPDCNVNSICESGLGENVLDCPLDCGLFMQVCSGESECQPELYCNGSFCSYGVTGVDGCFMDDNCAIGICGTNNICGRENSGSCTAISDCQSNYCVSEICQALFAPGNITSCGYINQSGNYNLTSSFGVGGSCLVVRADDVIINGRGYTLTGNIDSSGTGDGGNAFTSLIINNISVVGNVISGGAVGLTDVGGAGGNINFTNSNITGTISSTGGIGPGNGGSSGVIAILNSNTTSISSIGGNSDNSGSGGNSGAITITNSITTSIASTGGAGGTGTGFGANGGSSGAITITNSNITTISSIGGTGETNFGGSSGVITIINSTTLSISSTGGHGDTTSGGTGDGGSNGAITITNSNIATIYSLGGDSGVLTGGSASTIIITNSIFGNITAVGGVSDTDEGSTGGGNGGNVTAINSQVNITKLIINLIGGYGNGEPDGATGKLILNNTNLYNSFGVIKFSYVSTNQTLIGSILNISNNSAYVDSSKYLEYNVSANITFYNLLQTFSNPKIFRDGTNICDETTTPVCSNFTSLNAGTVIFNVSSWSNYSIVDDLSITACGTLGNANTVYTLTQNISGTGVCINVTADNVTINGVGFKITGDVSASGVAGGANASTGLVINNTIVVGNVLSYGVNGTVDNGGNGGSITLTNSNISGNVDSVGGIIVSSSNGIGGTSGIITLINSNASQINSIGGGNFGTASLINISSSIVSTIKSTTLVAQADSAPGRLCSATSNIVILNSKITTINSLPCSEETGGVTGEITIIGSNITTINSISGNSSYTGTAGGIVGAITILSSNVSSIIALGGTGSSNGANGAIIIINNSRIFSSITSNGGVGDSDSDSDGNGGSGGAITITYSMTGAIITIGADQDFTNGGMGGAVNITNSNITGAITANGGKSYTTPTGVGGTINLINSSIIGAITSNAGSCDAGDSANSGGTITLTNSNATTITSNGGDNLGYDGGAGGTITLTNSNATTITSNGGSSVNFGNGGNAGIIKVVNYDSDFSTTSISFAGGNHGIGEGIIHGTNGTLILNQTSFKNNFGAIKFSYVSTQNTTFSSIMNISNNSVYVDSSNYLAYNVSANVTLNNIRTNFLNPVIYRDGTNICNETTTPACSNFTSLNAGTVIFNVSSWSNYSIGENPLITICGSLTTPNIVYVLQNNITTTGTCFTIAANNVTLNLNGFTIKGNKAVLSSGVDISVSTNNFTLKDGIIERFEDAISFRNAVTGSTVKNLTLFNNSNSGISFTSCSDNLIDTIIASNNSYGIYGSGTIVNNRFYNLNLTLNSLNGLYFGGGTSGNNFSGIVVANTGGWGINLEFDSNSLFNNLESYDNVGYQLYSTDTFLSNGNILIYNNSFGEIKFAPNIATDNVVSNIKFGGGQVIQITNNSAFIDSNLVTELNKSANVTLTGLSTTFVSPKIFRDGTNVCDETTTPACSNFTSLNAGTVIFNVSSWSNYSILETYVNVTNILTINEAGVGGGITYKGENVTLNVTVEGNPQSVWLTIWQSFVGGPILLIQALTKIIGTLIWTTTFETNSSFNLGNVNYTINATNLEGETVSTNGTLTLQQGPKVYECTNLSTANRVYVLQNNVTTTETCFFITANNVTFNLNGFTITGPGAGSSPSYSGIISAGYNYTTLKNGTIKSFPYGIFLEYNFNCSIENIIAQSNSYGIYLAVSSNNTIRDSTLNSNSIGLYIAPGSYNQISNITTTGNSDRGILLPSGTNNIFTNIISFGNTNSQFSAIGTANFLIYNNSFGEIKWVSNSLSTAKSLTFPGNITIGNNFTYVSSVHTGLNITSNVTLYDLPITFTNPIILKNGAYCGSACYNFTSLNAGTVVFNVSNWDGNYSIGENQNPNITLNSPASGFSTTDTSVTFSFNVSGTQNMMNCTLNMNAANYSNQSAISKSGINNISVTGLAVASYTWNVSCTDELNAVGTSETRILSVTEDTGGITTGGGGECTLVNGGWSSWSTCSALCTQTRSCNNPSPSCGGTSCVGVSSQPCTGGDCSVCADECILGTVEKSCININTKRSRVCGNFDTDSCTEWGVWTSLTCSIGETCTGGDCGCVPNCVGKTCGDDGCGSSCGTCNVLLGESCSLGNCITDCVASCSGKSCGDDNCGGSCGTCGTGLVCSSGSCVTGEKPKEIPPEILIDVDEDCNYDFACGEWSECNAQYNVGDLISNSVISGIRTRLCIDNANCASNFFENQNCVLKEEVTAENKVWCGNRYTEIKNSRGQVIARLKPVGGSFIDVNLEAEGRGYCAYCFDKIQDYDETGTDCGGSCVSCSEKLVPRQELNLMARVLKSFQLMQLGFWAALLLFMILLASLIGLVKSFIVLSRSEYLNSFISQYKRWRNQGYDVEVIEKDVESLKRDLM